MFIKHFSKNFWRISIGTVSSGCLSIFLWAGCTPTILGSLATSRATPSPTPTFITQWGSAKTGISSAAGDEQARALAMDSSGNLYAAGSTTGSLVSAVSGSGDAWVSKSDTYGNIVWLKMLNVATFPALNNSAAFDTAQAVGVDGSGNVYVAGYTGGALGAAVSAGSVDTFLAKLDSSGGLVWIRQFTSVFDASITGTGDDQVQMLKVDSAGNSYLAGYTTAGITGVYGGGARDAWAAKIDTSGNLIWLREFTSAFDPSLDATALDTAQNIAFDAAGNAFVVGYTSGDLVDTSGGVNDAYVMKINAAGTFGWAKQFNAAFTGNPAASNEQGNGIAVHSSGRIYVGGETGGAFDGIASDGSNDMWLAQLDGFGNLGWLEHITSASSALITSAAGDERLRSIKIDTSENIYICGDSTGSFAGVNGGGGLSDVVVAKLSSTGTPVWIRQINTSFSSSVMSAAGLERGNSIFLDDYGYLGIGGYTNGSFAGANGGGEDVFLMKLNDSGLLQ